MLRHDQPMFSDVTTGREGERDRGTEGERRSKPKMLIGICFNLQMHSSPYSLRQKNEKENNYLTNHTIC